MAVLALSEFALCIFPHTSNDVLEKMHSVNFESAFHFSPTLGHGVS
jgi:hypothetical protein